MAKWAADEFRSEALAPPERSAFDGNASCWATHVKSADRLQSWISKQTDVFGEGILQSRAAIVRNEEETSNLVKFREEGVRFFKKSCPCTLRIL